MQLSEAEIAKSIARDVVYVTEKYVLYGKYRRISCTITPTRRYVVKFEKMCIPAHGTVMGIKPGRSTKIVESKTFFDGVRCLRQTHWISEVLSKL